jgi:uncharacterized damage-inducible protein DinB
LIIITHAKTVLLNQLLANANDRSWYLSFHESVEGVTEEEAIWKPDQESHSIAEIVQHLIHWNKIWQTRYEMSDFDAVNTLEENAKTFHATQDVPFADLKNELLDILLNWQTLITDEQSLDTKVQGFPVEAEWWAIIGNAATHNAYHIGQIVYLRKMKK